MKYLTVALLIVISLLLCGSLIFLIYQDSNKQAPAPSPSPTTTSQPTNTQAPAQTEPNIANKQQYTVKIYFSKHPDSDNDPSKTFPVNRTSDNLGVAKFAIDQLLIGPSQSEQYEGYFSYVKLRDDTSNCNGNDFTINIAGNIATLQFCKTFDHIGEISDGQAESNIKDTLKQFSSIQKVVILNKNGDCEFNLSGLNLCKQ